MISLISENGENSGIPPVAISRCLSSEEPPGGRYSELGLAQIATDCKYRAQRIGLAYYRPARDSKYVYVLLARWGGRRYRCQPTAPDGVAHHRLVVAFRHSSFQLLARGLSAVVRNALGKQFPTACIVLRGVRPHVVSLAQLVRLCQQRVSGRRGGSRRLRGGRGSGLGSGFGSVHSSSTFGRMAGSGHGVNVLLTHVRMCGF